MAIKNYFAAFVIFKRLQKHMSQRELADKLDYSQARLSYIEMGKTDLGIGKVAVILRGLESSFMEFESFMHYPDLEARFKKEVIKAADVGLLMARLRGGESEAVLY